MRWSTVFLDAGGVLLNPDWDLFERAFRQRGVVAPAALLAAADPKARHSLDVPEKISRTSDEERWRLYFDLVLESAGVPRSEETDRVLEDLRREHRARNLWNSVPETVRPFLARLREEGLRLVVVSNSNGTLRDHLRTLGLLPFFDLVIDSAEEGCEKPDPRIFAAALRRSESRPEKTVHLGDLYHVDVLGARGAGLDAILFDPLALYPEADCRRVQSLVPEAVSVLLAP